MIFYDLSPLMLVHGWILWHFLATTQGSRRIHKNKPMEYVSSKKRERKSEHKIEKEKKKVAFLGFVGFIGGVLVLFSCKSTFPTHMKP